MSSRVSRIVAAIAGLAFLLAPTTPAARAQALHLTGRGGDADWVETPVVVEVKAPIAAGAYVLEDASEYPDPGGRVPGWGQTMARGRSPARWPPVKPFSYAVKPQRSAGSTEAGGIRFRHSGADLEVTIDDRPLDDLSRRVPAASRSSSRSSARPANRSRGRIPWRTCRARIATIPISGRAGSLMAASTGSISGRKGRGTGTIQETERRVVVEGPVLGRLRTQRCLARGPTARWSARIGERVTFYRTRTHRIIDFEFDDQGDRRAR